jgi:uncharacterized protein (DUF2147 family)
MIDCCLKLVFSLMLIILSNKLSAQEHLTGTWQSSDGDGRIEFYRQDGKFSGKLVWASIPDARDENNPDPQLRNRKVVGMELFSGFEWNAKDQEWQNGQVYDPKSGKTYDSVLWIDKNEPDKLNIRGYVMGLRWLGRTEQFTRFRK